MGMGVGTTRTHADPNAVHWYKGDQTSDIKHESSAVGPIYWSQILSFWDRRLGQRRSFRHFGNQTQNTHTVVYFSCMMTAVSKPNLPVASVKRLIVIGALSAVLAFRLSSEHRRLLWTFETFAFGGPAVTRSYNATEHDYYQYDSEDHNNNDPADGATLPSCKSVMRKGTESDGGDFLTSPQTASGWTLRNDGSREYNLEQHCSLHRYTAHEARQCLLDKHIMFIGDSLTRFQVTSLVYLLERGRYPHRFDRSRHGACHPFAAPPPNETHSSADEYEQCSPRDKPNVCVADDFTNSPMQDSWSSFHHQVGGAADGGVYHGRMECDCSRGGLDCHKDRLGCDVENFFYASEPVKDNKRTAISFFFESGWGDHPRPIKGFNFTGCALTGTCRSNETAANERKDKAYNGTYNFYQPLGDALEKNGSLWQVIPPVDVSIYNRGLWGTLTTEQANRYMPLFRALTSQRQNGRCFFKSTTGSDRTSGRSFQHEQTTLRNITLQAGCSFLDLAQITKDFGRLPEKGADGEIHWERATIFQDSVHFRPWVYEEFNNILLNALCN
jgi:hypothetical protein